MYFPFPWELSLLQAMFSVDGGVWMKHPREKGNPRLKIQLFLRNKIILKHLHNLLLMNLIRSKYLKPLQLSRRGAGQSDSCKPFIMLKNFKPVKYILYCRVPPPIGLQCTVAWGHEWRTCKQWLKPPTCAVCTRSHSYTRRILPLNTNCLTLYHN